MDNHEQACRNDIEKALYMHGQLSLLFYKMADTWIVKKWGETEKLKALHQDTFNRYMKAGLKDEAESLTLMDLPHDVDMIYRILYCGSLKSILEEYGIIEHISNPLPNE